MGQRSDRLLEILVGDQEPPEAEHELYMAGAVTVSPVIPEGQGESKVLLTTRAFWAGSATPQCAEYLGLLLGLRAVARHPDCATTRRVICWGDSAPIARHLEEGGEPTPDPRQLIPLVELARQLRAELAERFAMPVNVSNRDRSIEGEEDKLARAALRARAPALEGPGDGGIL